MSDFAAHTSSRLAKLPQGAIPDDVEFVVEQRILDGELVVEHFHLVFDGGSVVMNPGPAPHADVTLCQDIETARALRAGEIHAQRAFLTGRLSVDGDIDSLLEHGALLASLLRSPDA